jgi:hypothetical protein
MNADTNIRVLQVQDSVHADQGGLATFTAALCDALVAGGVSTNLVTHPLKEGIRAAVLPSDNRVGIPLPDSERDGMGRRGRHLVE